MYSNLFTKVAEILLTDKDGTAAKNIANIAKAENEILSVFLSNGVAHHMDEVDRRITQENVQRLLLFCEHWEYVNIDDIILQVQVKILRMEIDLYNMTLTETLLIKICKNSCVAGQIHTPWTYTKLETNNMKKSPFCECAKHNYINVIHTACFLCIVKTWNPSCLSDTNPEGFLDRICRNLNADKKLIIFVVDHTIKIPGGAFIIMNSVSFRRANGASEDANMMMRLVRNSVVEH